MHFNVLVGVFGKRSTGLRHAVLERRLVRVEPHGRGVGHAEVGPLRARDVVEGFFLRLLDLALLGARGVLLAPEEAVGHVVPRDLGHGLLVERAGLLVEHLLGPDAPLVLLLADALELALLARLGVARAARERLLALAPRALGPEEVVLAALPAPLLALGHLVVPDKK